MSHVVESHRLTGPHLLGDHPGAALDVAIDARSDETVAAWRAHARRLLDAPVPRGELRRDVVARLGEGCAGLGEMVDIWYLAGEWAQQWHTMSRCLIALERIGQFELAAQVFGAIEAHTTMGSPPTMATLQRLAFEARDSVAAQLGADRNLELRAIGASLPLATLVDRTRSALRG